MAVNSKFIDEIVKDVNRSHGRGSSERLSRSSILCKVKSSVSSGSAIIDDLIRGQLPDLSRPLIPFGRFTEITGLEASGKTSLCYHLMAQTQMSFDESVIILGNTEETFDVDYCESLGVDVSGIVLLPTQYLEDLFEKAATAIYSARNANKKAAILFIWDSVGATRTYEEMKADEGDKQPHNMKAAKAIGNTARWFVNICAETNAAMVYTNHMYMKPVRFGNPWEVYGGQRLKYYATLRIFLSKKKQIKFRDQVIGDWVEVFTKKNKMSPPYKKALVPLLNGLGFCDDYIIFENANSLPNLTKKKGSWITFTPSKGEEVKAQGWDGFVDEIMTHPLYDEEVYNVYFS